MTCEKKATVCPKCGSDAGYQYKLSTEYIQHENWKGEPLYAEQTGDGTEFKSRYCIDCDANVTAFVKKLN